MQSYPQCSITVYVTGGPSGSVTTSGTAVTWAAGTLFNANGQWSGLTITINSVPYTISSCASSTSCTLGSSAGTQTSPVTYSMATTTPAAIYTSTGTAQTNPFVSSLQGYWQFYADNGQYDIKLSGGGIPAPFTWGAQDLIDPLSLPNTVSDLVCKTAGCVVTLCATAAAQHQTLLMSRMWDINGTCAANIQAFTGGGFAPGSGHTTTLTGSFDGDLTQHFDLSAGGTVTLSAATGTRRPEWWGAKADFVLPNTITTDSLLPISYALAQGGTVQFAKGKYYSSAAITASVASTQIVGMGGPGDIDCTTASTCLVFAAGQGGITVGTSAVASSVKGIMLFSKSTGSGSGQNGIRVRAGSVIVDSVNVIGFGGHGWDAETDNVDHGKVTNSFLYGNYGDGMHIDSGDANSMVVQGNRLYNNGGWGINQVNSGGANLFAANDATANGSGGYTFLSSNTLLNNYVEGSALMQIRGNGNFVQFAVFGSPTLSKLAGGNVYVGGTGCVEIDNAIQLGCDNANTLNLDASSGASEIDINRNGKANAPVNIMNGSGTAKITLDPNGRSIFVGGGITLTNGGGIINGTNLDIGAGTGNGINLQAASGASEIAINFTGKANVPLNLYDGAGVLKATIGTAFIQGNGYRSADGSSGITGASCSAWKNGLCVSP